MTLSIQHLKQVEQHWAVQAIPEATRQHTLEQADAHLVKTSLGHLLPAPQADDFDPVTTERVATAYELAAIEGLRAVLYPSQAKENQQLQNMAQAGAFLAFGLYRVLPVPHETERRLFHILHLAGLAYCGDRWTDLRRWFTDHKAAVEIPSVADVSWDKRLLFRLFDAWMRLLRKQHWDDLEQIAEIVLGLRNDQASHESQLLNNAQGAQGKSLALRLIALYHLATATERLAVFMLQGEPPAIETTLDQHFEAAIKASEICRDMQLEMILRWLHLVSRKMVLI